MENDISKQNRSWGEVDLEEDKDTFSPYNVKNLNVNVKPGGLTGFVKNVEPAVTKAERKQKSKVKPNRMVATKDNAKLQQGSFHFSYNPENENSSNIEKPATQTNDIEIRNLNNSEEFYPNMENPTMSTNNFQSQIISNVSQNQILLNSQPMLNNSNLTSPYARPISYQNIWPHRFIHPFYNQLGIVNVGNIGMEHMRMPNYPHQIPFQQPTQISQQAPVQEKTKPSYHQRVEVIDSLFKFIIQMLRSPEQPSVDQIEFLKSSLDSLVVNKVNVTK